GGGVDVKVTVVADRAGWRPGAVEHCGAVLAGGPGGAGAAGGSLRARWRRWSGWPRRAVIALGSRRPGWPGRSRWPGRARRALLVPGDRRGALRAGDPRVLEHKHVRAVECLVGVAAVDDTRAVNRAGDGGPGCRAAASKLNALTALMKMIRARGHCMVFLRFFPSRVAGERRSRGHHQAGVDWPGGDQPVGPAKAAP